MIINNINFNENIIDNIKEDSINPYAFFKEHNIKITENIDFEDDYWDFNNKNILKKDSTLYRYDFSQIDYRYKDILKKIILDSLLIEKKSASTVKNCFIQIRKFILYLQDKSIYSANRITKNIVKEYFSNKDISARTKQNYKRMLKNLLWEIEHHNEGLSYLEIYDYLSERDNHKISAQIDAGKTKIIPNDIFDKMVSLALMDIKDTTISKKDKYIACMIVLLAETGMRIGEFARLEKDKVREFKIDEERRIDYLEFITYKTIRNNNLDGKWTETYINDKAKFAYDTMCKLSKDKPSKYIFYTKNKNNFNPCGTGLLRKYLLRFILRHYKELKLDKSKGRQDLYKTEIKCYDIGPIGCEFKNLIGETIYTIQPHQFRVTVCTRLYERGISLEIIQQHMNHLSKDMTYHYIRMKNMEEKKLKAKNLLKSRINSDGEFIETDINKVKNERLKEELKKEDIRKKYEAINSFIKKGKFNIMKDIDKILDILIVSNTPLGETPEGYCAMGAVRDLCEIYEYVSSPNNDSIMSYIPAIECVNITYNLFKDKVKLVEHNKKVANNNHLYKVEYSRELKVLKSFINNRFLPELQLVKDKVENLGIEKSINFYPNLEDIIPNLDNIDKEIALWI